MTKQRGFAVVAIATLAISVTALSCSRSSARDFYINGSIGSEIPQKVDVKSADVFPVPNDNTFPWHFDYEPTRGLMGSVAIGMYVRPDIRLETQFSYMKVWDADVNRTTDTGWAYVLGKHKALGDFSRKQFLVNALYDFDEISGIITPYIGGGLGYTWYTADDAGILQDWGSKHFLNGTDGFFTYALHLGAKFRLRDNLFLTTRYSLANRDRLKFRGYELRPVDANGNPDLGNFNPDHYERRNLSFNGIVDSGVSHSFNIGLTYKFGSPPETYKD